MQNRSKLEIKDTTDTASSVSYLDIHLKIDSGCRLRMKLYDKEMQVGILDTRMHT
jgi:hypothetical protein